ncbi:unnamed protein product [Vicia faba]|uniref:EF-hand domain-containing protein n=1 Tax=Vicia faba TaxID=3906 RepID=A0AAV0ZMB6_VICFA|nr:unnamed protein product [Vicia faba]
MDSSSYTDNQESRTKSDEGLFKDLANILYKLFTILAALVALNYTETALQLISPNIAIITFALWLIVIIVVVVSNYRFQREITRDIVAADSNDVVDALIPRSQTSAEDVLKKMSHNGDGNCKGVESEMEKVFNKLDTNCDGKISISDLRSVMEKLGQPATDEENKTMIREFDDGESITLQEFIDLSITNVDSDEEVDNLRDAFSVFDVDEDGFITAEELETMMKSLGEDSSLAECRKMIGGLDSNGDGRIDLEEFRVMMMGSRR